jgi:hypothetical protein
MTCHLKLCKWQADKNIISNLFFIQLMKVEQKVNKKLFKVNFRGFSGRAFWTTVNVIIDKFSFLIVDVGALSTMAVAASSDTGQPIIPT